MPAQPCLFIIFGATGDLTTRKLIPALYQLSQQGAFDSCHILGVARSTSIDDSSFRDGRFHYLSVPEGSEEGFSKLTQEIENLERRYKLPGNRVFYLALPPWSFVPTIESLGRAGLNRSPGWTRLVEIMDGDQALFVRNDWVERSWRLYDPLLKSSSSPVHPYPAGTWGPPEAIIYWPATGDPGFRFDAARSKG